MQWILDMVCHHSSGCYRQKLSVFHPRFKKGFKSPITHVIGSHPCRNIRFTSPMSLAPILVVRQDCIGQGHALRFDIDMTHVLSHAEVISILQLLPIAHLISKTAS